MRYGMGGFSLLPEVVKNLLILNGLMFLATIVFNAAFGIDLRNILGLHYPFSNQFQPYQVVTYMFMHGDFMHLFFNMFAIWMFGNSIENAWGSKRFLLYYLLTGFGAAFLHYFIWYIEVRPELLLMNNFIYDPAIANLQALIANHRFHVHPVLSSAVYDEYLVFKESINILTFNETNIEALNQAQNFISQYKDYFLGLPNVVGASGSLFGILLAFGMMFPNTHLMLLFFPFPIKAKYFVLGYGLIELYSGLRDNPGDNVAHFAHLGGMLFGFLLIMYWKKKGTFY